MSASFALAAVLIGGALLAFSTLAPAAPSADVLAVDDLAGLGDAPRTEPIDHPAWFKESFLDLPADLKEAAVAGKQGLMVYFGQLHCAYCHKLMTVNFGSPDIVAYTRQHFDVVALDIWGIKEVTGLDGQRLTERTFAEREQNNFTPAILFYDAEGQLALRLRGYYPPYQFRAALEYVADGHYRRESFRDYLARGDNRMVFDEGDLNDEPFFAPPPYNLDRRYPSKRPLAVFFEQGDCHACDVLHGQSLRDEAISRRVAEAVDSIQLDLRADTPLVTPAGQTTTARAWAAEMGLFYAPSILFFDEHGREVLRVDSVAGFNRLRSVMTYIGERAYRTASYQEWRQGRTLPQ
ncbi:MAG TPA: thioredoxin fold domain-containing protein [Lamprocystis sp. (in: g-proteobacteria)]|nr:thioredoxin fold domain-containing protein [Lamprocystis sp. (in: g-proteobacteria)]